MTFLRAGQLGDAKALASMSASQGWTSGVKGCPPVSLPVMLMFRAVQYHDISLVIAGWKPGLGTLPCRSSVPQSPHLCEQVGVPPSIQTPR